MKKTFNYLIITILFFLLLFTSLSCDLLKSDEEIKEFWVNELITALENNDKEGLKKIFAEERIKDISDFDDSIEKLLEYYDNATIKNKSSSYCMEGETDYNFSAYWYDISCKIETSTSKYRIAFRTCNEYSSNEKEEGIWSLYIIKEEELLELEYTYWGDGLWTPGINIGKNYVKD